MTTPPTRPSKPWGLFGAGAAAAAACAVCCAGPLPAALGGLGAASAIGALWVPALAAAAAAALAAQGAAQRVPTAVHDVRDPPPLADDSVDAVFAHVLLRLAGDLSGPTGPGAAAGRILREPDPVLLRRPVSWSG
ncbi:hypothetical protein ACWEO1_25645 [Kitasatospora cineracea]